VAIGRAIVRRPSLFLMDEPLTNLDAKLREALRVELARLRRTLQTPMLFVTHDQAEALSMGDRIVVLSEGRILQMGTPEEIYRNPTSPTVARQLGQPRINLLAVEERQGRFTTMGGMPVVAARGEVPPRHPMTLGIRPEDITLEGGAHAGTVELIENTGPAKVAIVAWAGERIHVLIDKDTTFKLGDKVYPRLDPGRVVLWEKSQCP
jgi:multiple sugar transport system ATP-binding protein